MKTSLSILFLFFFIIQNSFGQVEPRLTEEILYLDSFSDSLVIRRITHFSYHHSGKIKEEIIDTYNQNEEFVRRSGIFSTYDENGYLLKETNRRYNPDINLWITMDWLEYKYDENGCKIESQFIRNIGGLISKNDYERNADCQITKETKWVRNTAADSLIKVDVNEINYLQDDLSYELKKFDIDDLTGETILVGMWEYLYNSNKQLVEYSRKTELQLNNNWNGFKEIYAYDDEGNITRQSTYLNNPDNTEFNLVSELVYLNEYDIENQLIKITKERYGYISGVVYLSSGSPQVINIDYACLDLKEREIFINSNGELTKQYEYEYEGEDDCFEIEEALLGISIFLNPTFGAITIQSPILQSGNTQIKLFDMNGKLLLEKNEFRREEKIELDLRGLPNGMYVIQLMNQEHFIQEKIMVMN